VFLHNTNQPNFTTFDLAMRTLFITISLLVLSLSCSKNPNSSYSSDNGISHTIFFFLFKNHEVYQVKAGEVVPIYYSINSCCFNCAPNRDELRNLKFLGEKVIIGSPHFCTGCDVMIGMFFRAESVGVDTILRMHTAPYADCNKELKGFDRFIVNIH
jgi:hypothetical protein